ncbi:sensor histidine kinase [Serpentinicella alkaliphila]|uniref:sensor histidine kinase n=1 Tax=Serpentinicella alkaliphila TaxID=1734049 RepID=UPI002ED4DFC6
MTIKSKQKLQDIILEVIDDGVGMDWEPLNRLMDEKNDNKSIGIKNVNKRLVNLYGEDYCLTVDSKINEGTCVQIRIPLYT